MHQTQENTRSKGTVLAAVVVVLQSVVEWVNGMMYWTSHHFLAPPMDISYRPRETETKLVMVTSKLVRARDEYAQNKMKFDSGILESTQIQKARPTSRCSCRDDETDF